MSTLITNPRFAGLRRLFVGLILAVVCSPLLGALPTNAAPAHSLEAKPACYPSEDYREFPAGVYTLSKFAFLEGQKIQITGFEETDQVAALLQSSQPFEVGQYPSIPEVLNGKPTGLHTLWVEWRTDQPLWVHEITKASARVVAYIKPKRTDSFSVNKYGRFCPELNTGTIG